MGKILVRNAESFHLITLLANKEVKIDNLRKIHDDLWKKYKTPNLSDGQRFNLDSYIEEVYASASKHATELLTNHLFLLESACECFLLLFKVIGKGSGNQQRGAFLAQLHRVTNYALCIRHLLTTGFEDSCRPLTRSFIEALDISMACFISQEFSAKIFGDEQIEYDELWRSEVGYGKITRYVVSALEKGGIPNEDIEAIISHRKDLKNTLSSTVHGEGAGAFRSWAPPVLGYPEMLSTTPHGVISFHTANHVISVIRLSYSFLAAILNCISSGDFTHLHEFETNSEEFQSFCLHLLVFQEMYHTIELLEGNEIIAPDCESRG